MAELLVRAQASTNSKSSEVGDIICVQPDGWSWGKAEGLPEYVVAKYPGVSVSAFEEYKRPLRVKVEKEFSFRMDKSQWETKGVNHPIFENVTTTPIAILQGEGDYLVMGKHEIAEIKKRRKWQFSKDFMEKYFPSGVGEVTINGKKQENFLSNLVEKA